MGREEEGKQLEPMELAARTDGISSFCLGITWHPCGKAHTLFATTNL